MEEPRSLISDLKKDCRNIVEEFVEAETTCFSHFLDLWKKRQFDLIYAGQGEKEIDYFVIHVLHAAKSFALALDKPRNHRVAGLYLLYMLYYCQPLKTKIPVRLIPDEFKSLEELASEFKTENVEVSYAFYKMLLSSCFDFAATPLPYDETLIHYKEEIKSRGAAGAQSQDSQASASAKNISTALLKEVDFDLDKWRSTLAEYNSLKTNINTSCSSNLPLTKDFSDTQKPNL